MDIIKNRTRQHLDDGTEIQLFPFLFYVYTYQLFILINNFRRILDIVRTLIEGHLHKLAFLM